MGNTKALVAAYGRRFKIVIESSPDPKATMDEIAFEAQRSGLIDSNHLPRRSDSRAFVMDLWTENPAVAERINLYRETMKKPSAVLELSDVLDVLR
jgi:hypothetical protein